MPYTDDTHPIITLVVFLFTRGTVPLQNYPSQKQLSAPYRVLVFVLYLQT
jgi:hypothetical protein